MTRTQRSMKQTGVTALVTILDIFHHRLLMPKKETTAYRSNLSEPLTMVRSRRTCAGPARLAHSLQGCYPTTGAGPIQEEEDRTSPTLFDVEENNGAADPHPYLPGPANGILTPHL